MRAGRIIALLSTATVVLGTVSLASAQIAQSPVAALTEQDDVLRVEVDPLLVGALASGAERFTLEGFPLPGGEVLALDLEAFDVLDPDARIIVASADSQDEIGRPEVSLFRGNVVGRADERVFLSFSEYGTHGLLQHAGSTYVLTSGRFGEGRPTVIADLASFPEPPDFAEGWECHVGPEHVNPLGLDLGHAHDGDQGPAVNPCRIARVAIEGDYEYTAWLFGGSAEASAAYSITLMGAVSEIYTRDLNVRLLVPFIRLWEDENDPYDGDKLGQFRNEWNANMRDVERELAHLLSGNYGGGVAWVSVLCHNTYGYGLSGVGGSFPYPLRDYDHGNWDLMVVAHELGHNFGTLHTHDGYDPTIDDCGNGDCSNARGGTIMSYCHTCAGGMSNIVIGFHPRVIEFVSGYLDGACNILGDGLAYAYDDTVSGLEDHVTAIDVLANDIPINCSPLSLVLSQGTTDQGGTTAVSAGTGEGGRDEVLYTPPADFVGQDSFFYVLETDTGEFADAIVSVDVFQVREADTLGASRPGLHVDYYELPSDTELLPDFGPLTSYASDFFADVNIESSHGLFATSGRYEFVGAVLEAAIEIPESGYYTLFIESDDGTRLYVGDDLLIDNDGVHTMTERSGGIGLEAGFHRIRIEYFERQQQQGLIARIEGPGMAKQVVPASMWRTDTCLADWIPDGSVDTIDFIGFLAVWGAGDAEADLNGDGSVNTQDFILFLGAWSAGC